MPGFIQITDTHIVAPGALAYGCSDTAKALRSAVATINTKLSVLDGIDCVIVTGDLTDHGTPEEYTNFIAIISELELPWQAVPGNHDRRDVMRSAFAPAPWIPETGPIHWVRDFGPFSMIGLDTLLEGAHYGELSSEGFEFLDTALAAIGTQPAVIASHHPWVHSGIPEMDADNLRGGEMLMSRLEAHPAAVRMISGHVHRAVTGQIGRVTCQISPATCHSVLTDHRVGYDPQLTIEPGSITVFRWSTSPQPGLLSDIVPIGSFPGPWPFTD